MFQIHFDLRVDVYAISIQFQFREEIIQEVCSTYTQRRLVAY
jgi:hypothetical protein